MRTFARKPHDAAQETTAGKSLVSGRAHDSFGRTAISTLQAPDTIGHQSTSLVRHDIRRIPTHPPAAGATPPAVDAVLRSPGQPLNAATRASMESRFSPDFSGVRVHSDIGAASSAAAVQARAYTVGNHIVLGAGQPSADSLGARFLLAHELAHVVQQSGGAGRRMPGVSSSAPHEADARAAALAVVTGVGQVRVSERTGIGVARQTLDDAVMVANDLVLQKLGQAANVASVRDVERGLQTIAGSGGSSAAAAAGLAADIDKLADLATRQRQLREALIAGRALVTKNIPDPPRSRDLASVKRGLVSIEGRGGRDAAAAREIANDIERLRSRVRELEEVRLASTQIFQAPNTAGRRVKSAPKSEPKIRTPTSVRTAPVVEVPSTAATTGAAKVESAVAGTAGADIKAATRLARVGSGVAKFGSMAFHVLLPGPLDALALMAQFAGSYAEAHDAIRDRNTRTGFAIGLSASLLGRSGRAVQEHFAR
ncbi:MAG: DUF4157 domain-containing protein [Phycisphaerae bacterium]|nr:DUF4157 domain-containing protein [Phycisphaerae bacterium]